MIFTGQFLPDLGCHRYCELEPGLPLAVPMEPTLAAHYSFEGVRCNFEPVHSSPVALLLAEALTAERAQAS